MANYIEIAKSYVRAGYSVIPVNSTKSPAIAAWGKLQIAPPTEAECEKMFSDCWGFALLTGGSSRVWLLDVDCKYDLSGTLWEDLKNSIPKTILEKAYVQSTMNGGYHLAFIVPENKVEPNAKYASRYTTEYEKHETYLQAFKSPELRRNALKIALQDSSRVLLESRGGSSSKVCGGFFLMPPSPGYKHIYGKLQEITEDEYDVVVDIARSFNEVIKEDTKLQTYDNGDWVQTPFDHFSEEGDAVELLINAGWNIISENKQVIRFKRPGLVSSASSALYDKESRIFSCFTTSSCFEAKSYNAVGVLANLEFDECYNSTYNYLVKNGYGKK
jgi:hypothetical protein